MMKSLRKWLEKSGYNPEKVKLFGGVFAIQKNKRLFFPCRMCSGLVWMQKNIVP